MASNKLIKKVYIDGNILVKNGTFIGKNICIYADDSYKVDADKIIEDPKLRDGIFEITENYGSPYIEYYASGGFTFYEKDGAFIYIKKISDAYYYFKRNPKLCYRISLDNFSSSFRYFSSNLSQQHSLYHQLLPSHF